MITIEKAGPTDTPVIADLGARTFIESHGHSGPAEDIESFVSSNYDLETVNKDLANAENIFNIIYFKNQPAGFSKIILNHPHPFVESKAITKLEKIYLLKEFYDLKLGLALFKFIVSLSKKENQEGIWLVAWIENQRAIRFYEKNGFRIVGNSFFKVSENHSNPNYVMYLKY